MPDFSFDLEKLPEFTAIRTFEHHDCLSSTSDRVRKLLCLPSLLKLPCLVIARQQTAGRGRGNKSWWSGDGALLMSLGFELEAIRLDRTELPLLSLAVAMSILEIIEERVSEEHETGLHWPNDVYVDGQKISGILLEAPTARHVVVGVGVNINNLCAEIPAELRKHFEKHPITSLIDLTGKETELPTFVRQFLFRLHENIERLSIDRIGFIDETKRYCVQVGRKITVRQGKADLYGRCHGIAPDGGLLLETASGIETVHSGVTHHKEPDI